MASRLSRTLEGLGTGIGRAGNLMMQAEIQDRMPNRFYQRQQGAPGAADPDLLQFLRSLGIRVPDAAPSDPEQSY